jgi:hypothetical protein
MSGVSIISFYSILISAAFIAAIGLDLLFRKPKRREERVEDRRENRAPLPDGIDPVSLREFRPLTQRLSGAVLLLAVGVIMIALRPLLT